MTELGSLDEKAFANLLTDHWSTEFKATRRNLIFVAFVVILVGWLGVPLADVSVFGMKVPKGADIRIY